MAGMHAVPLAGMRIRPFRRDATSPPLQFHLARCALRVAQAAGRRQGSTAGRVADVCRYPAALLQWLWRRPASRVVTSMCAPAHCDDVGSFPIHHAVWLRSRRSTCRRGSFCSSKGEEEARRGGRSFYPRSFCSSKGEEEARRGGRSFYPRSFCSSKGEEEARRGGRSFYPGSFCSSGEDEA